ncbi:hypothetical protein Barb4_04819 [Bacteroidales bacterium Barb4]|nr:hypothetical protein Barb4_04819 [Bacteroidales bacterium Barb4]
MTATCATPPVDKRRGRNVQSASVRRSSSEVLSAVSPIIMISPKIDDWGPSVGLPAVSGSDSPTTDSFSDTIWRAR